ncbi:MAG TPA: hypothetical protein VHH35_18390, partial [Pyrinomonadaceae bacterium]|nr:hypothetical protein [Pyrinomonadaceae bacterium]
IHMGNGHTLGEAAGSTAVTITQQTMPQHLHFAQGSSNGGDTPTAIGNLMASALNVYRQADNLVTLRPESVTNIGGSQPHNNMMPYLVLNFIIALQGIFPSRN